MVGKIFITRSEYDPQLGKTSRTRTWVGIRRSAHVARTFGSSSQKGIFFETADPSEVTRRYHGEVIVTQVEVPVG
jgi:hypothetical protein